MWTLMRHPLVILLVGVFFSSLFVPYVTRRWQNRHKELDVQTGLVSEIAEAAMRFLVSIEGVRVIASQFRALPAKYRDDPANPAKRQFDEAGKRMNEEYYAFTAGSAVIGTKLEAYLSTTPIPRLWTELAAAIVLLYAAEGVSEAERAKLMSKIDQKFEDWKLTPAQRSAAAGRALQRGEGRDQDWLVVEELLLEQKSVLIDQVLDSAIPAFDSTPHWLRRLKHLRGEAAA